MGPQGGQFEHPLVQFGSLGCQLGPLGVQSGPVGVQLGPLGGHFGLYEVTRGFPEAPNDPYTTLFGLPGNQVFSCALKLFV